MMERIYKLLRAVNEYPAASAFIGGFAVLILNGAAKLVKAFQPHITINKTTHIHNVNNDGKNGNNDGNNDEK